MRERQVRVSSTGEIFPCRICWDACARVQSLGEDDSVPATVDAANNAASVSRRVGVDDMDVRHYRRRLRKTSVAAARYGTTTAAPFTESPLTAASASFTRSS